MSLYGNGGIVMAWVAVDYNGRENIYSSHQIRSNIYYDEISILGNPFGDIEDKTIELKWLIGDYPDDKISIPKGSIKKLIGKELTWEDEPVELK